MRGAALLGQALSEFTGLKATVVGTSQPLVQGGWSRQLAAALPDLRLLSQRIGELLDDDLGLRPLTTMGRCSASLATLPQVARKYPNAAIVWFDAHGDCNVPAYGPNPEMRYLGGMVLTGAAGLWKTTMPTTTPGPIPTPAPGPTATPTGTGTGLGAGLALNQVILVGSRDLDPPEQALIDAGEIHHVAVGKDLPVRLREAIGGRDAYVHIDCDVLDAGLLPTEYESPGGLSFAELGDACAMLAGESILGIEISEYEGEWPDGKPGDLNRLIDTLAPLLEKKKTYTVRLGGS
jgi:arginase family enzyme